MTFHDPRYQVDYSYSTGPVRSGSFDDFGDLYHFCVRRMQEGQSIEVYGDLTEDQAAQLGLEVV